MNKLLIFTIFLIIASCQDQEQIESADFSKVELLTVDTSHWDLHSQNQFKKKQFSKLSIDEKINYAEILITHENYTNAIQILNRIKPMKSSYLKYLKAQALIQLNQTLEATDVLLTIPIEKMHSSAKNTLFESLIELGLTKRVIKLSQKQKKTTVISDFYLAIAHLQNHNCTRAIELLKKTIEAQPKATKVFATLAIAYQQCNDDIKAKNARSLQGTISLTDNSEFPNRLLLNGNPVNYYKNLLSTHLNQGDYSQIILISEKLISLNYKNSKILMNYVVALYKANRLDKAIKTLELLLKDDENNIKALVLLYEFNKNINYEKALKAINQLIKLAPDDSKYSAIRKQLITFYHK